MSVTKNPRIIALFDVDGTLTAARKEVLPDMVEFIKTLRERITIGVVGGSDLPKQKEQLGESVMEDYDYSFSQNGLVAYKAGELIGQQTISKHVGEENLKKIINWVLKYMSGIDIPVKRGTFIEFRTGMLNISPVGRNCSQEERDAFEQYDNVHKIRETMVAAMREEFADLNLTFSIGGQISFDLFPTGWDKTFCLQFLGEGTAEYDEIHFFGDKTFKGGNDNEIFESERTIGHTVTSPADTIQQCKELFFKD
uniref:Phosphomannomutase n=1 Tax=Saccharina japonica TaxID=88149 RepID=A0A0A0RTZ6_SACJA|nr:phosphomannomutase [Saccharina japonica]AUN86412.1 phosphomannomutase [Saccharina japonica]